MRPIDADALEEVVQTNLRENPHKDGRARAFHYTEYIHFLDVIRRMPTIPLPPSDPLTVEELRGMEAEWVWLKFLVPVYGMETGYYIKKAQFSDADKICCGYPGLVVRNLVYAGYGDSWLAYRRRPEETDHAK